ncbi:hypothetical protein SPRG_20570 [Saprolegnia parasitica CBS 223.65]|uniref:Thioredoxin domain-containing protein n=1 Tax=Saprolegnia parasitica (strain CBS 223.65) TaxID=695850 RepID=A0A067C8F6_SAPPC|nr:hypothetical protein SPRG_20570 [Saprolegnia parasitica CBS 223.65]KDO26768.1 hypothetical protein SPRG_20570 [Saprolegnia parasitica CBS 223.65]|eukprot:XP_012202522.1 hypothetical protein SPRG_20570 [Saprolegnia parasitica CBS 223.65]
MTSLMTSWHDLVGPRLRLSGGKEVATADHLASTSVVGLYFSAHWCGPCREFTPTLSTLYDDILDAHPDFDVVFVSSDKSEDDFCLYHDEMPFPALPWADRTRQAALREHFHIRFLPALVILNTVDGSHAVVRNACDGRRLFVSANGNVDKIWDTVRYGPPSLAA